MKSLAVALIAGAVLAASPLAAHAEPKEGSLDLLEKKTYADADGKKLPYRLLQPMTVDPKLRYPLVVFLHGAGERGDDNEKQLVHGVPEFLKPENRKDYPCFLIAPQCPENQKWVDVDWGAETNVQPEKPSESMRLVLGLIDQMPKDYPIDAKRIYITGLSMGGYGTWDVDRTSARPVCGGRADLRRRRREHGPEDRQNPPLGVSRLEGPRREGEPDAPHDRGAEESRRRSGIYDLSRRRPRLMGPGVPRRGDDEVAVRAKEGVGAGRPGRLRTLSPWCGASLCGEIMAWRAPRNICGPKSSARSAGSTCAATFIVEGFLAGLHASPFQGFCVEFSEHRKYVPGDDLKDLDWNVYAKTDKYYLKKFQAETNVTGYLAMDLGAVDGLHLPPGTDQVRLRHLPGRGPRLPDDPPAGPGRPGRRSTRASRPACRREASGRSSGTILSVLANLKPTGTDRRGRLPAPAGGDDPRQEPDHALQRPADRPRAGAGRACTTCGTAATRSSCFTSSTRPRSTSRSTA